MAMTQFYNMELTQRSYLILSFKQFYKIFKPHQILRNILYTSNTRISWSSLRHIHMHNFSNKVPI